MTPSYVGVVKHVRYWRGNVHRWSTVYPFTGSPSSSFGTSDAQALLTADDAMCYGASASEGGTYFAAIYDVTAKGSPIAQYTRFPWATPASWVKYGAQAWSPLTYSQEPVAETALVVEWPVGLSRTGKPVRLKKWYHAVPGSAGDGASFDVPPSVVAGLNSYANALTGVFSSKGLLLGTSSTRLAGTAIVSRYYGNHQMPKGRRRKPLVTASGRYTGPAISGRQIPVEEAD